MCYLAACEQCVHKHCVDELGEPCSKKKKRVSAFVKPSKQGMYMSHMTKIVLTGLFFVV